MRTPFKLGLMAALVGSAFVSQSAMAAMSVPDVSACTQQPTGLPYTILCMKYGNYETYVASQHDDFISYSIKALATIQTVAPKLLPTATYGDWTKMKSGAGTFDVGIFVGANGGGVAANDSKFFPPAISSNVKDDPFTGVWGGAGADGTPFTVQEIYNWLQTDPKSQYPVFYMDMTEPGTDKTSFLTFTGSAYVTDVNGNILAEWAFDNLAQAGIGTYDPDAKVIAPGSFTTYINGNPYTIDNNLGSGKPDFITYAPNMNLADWIGDGKNQFWVKFTIGDTGGAAEEIYLTKLSFDRPPPPIPEPGMLALLGAGLLGLGFSRVRKARVLGV